MKLSVAFARNLRRNIGALAPPVPLGSNPYRVTVTDIDSALRAVFGFCGEGGIRTLGTVARTHDFQSCTFGHSVTSPGGPEGRAGRAGPSLCQREEREQDSEFTVRWLRVALVSGESGIRTHGTLTRTPDFESGTFGRSVISPPRTMAARVPSVNEPNAE
jgi:hypothetical protein